MRTDIDALLLVLIAIDADKLARIAGKRTACNATGKPRCASKNSLDGVGGRKTQAVLASPVVEIGADRFGFHAIAIAHQNQWRKIASHRHLPCSSKNLARAIIASAVMPNFS